MQTKSINKKIYDADGNLKYYNKNQYDANSHLIKREFYDKEGNLEQYWLLEYDDVIIKSEKYDGSG